MSSNRNDFHVIGAGLGRTGTATLKKALEILGFGPTYHMYEVIKNSRAKEWLKVTQDPSNSALLDSLLAGSGYRSSCDFPSASFWKEQMQLYPDAKVVLTTRDPEKWYESCTNTIFRFQRDHPASNLGLQIVGWLGLPTAGFRDMTDALIRDKTFRGDWSKENVIKCFKAHNKNVLETCPKEKLFVFEVSQGWEPLCKFLDVPVPNEPFPHVNDTKEFQQLIHKMTIMGYATLGLAALGAYAVAWAGLKYMSGSPAAV
jgi:hypothetical protein